MSRGKVYRNEIIVPDRCFAANGTLVLLPALRPCFSIHPNDPTDMIEHHLDMESAILHIRPQSSLEKADFEELAKTVDPFIAELGSLAGLIIETRAFPGWESLGAMVAHIRFVRDHHRHIRKIAVVTDSAMGSVAEHLASHFVSAEIKHFPASGLDAAKEWILENT